MSPVRESYSRLSPLEEKVIRMRYGAPPWRRPHTHSEIAKKLQVAKQQIVKITREAVIKLRRPKYENHPVRSLLPGKQRTQKKHLRPAVYTQPHPSQTLNLPMLKALREAKGMPQWALSHELGLASDTYSLYECGKVNMPLAIFRELCRFHRLDPLSMAELLRLPGFDSRLLRRFHQACLRHNTTPAEALRDFMTVFCQSEV